MKWYKRDPDAALAGMIDLGPEERGIYNTVIDLLYSRDGNLPTDDAFFARACCCRPQVWRRVRDQLIAKGKLHYQTDGKLMANRVVNELQTAGKLMANMARLGRVSAEKRKENKTSIPTEPSVTTTSTTTTTSTNKVVALRAPPPKGTRLPENWQPSDNDLAFAQREGVTGEDLRVQIVRFRNYWTSKSGASACKTNWARTWENWVLDGRQRNGKRTGSGGGGSKGSDFFAGIAEVAANISGDGQLAGSADSDVPLGRVNIDGERA